MSTRYTNHFSTKNTKQNQAIPGKKQIQNSDGCYVFEADKWKQLMRFLILGSEGGSYYASERKLTEQNATSVLDCIEEDGRRVVDTVIEVSVAGRAPSNDPAIFVLAMCAKLATVEDVRQYALASVSKVCRIGTHLFHFAEFVENFGGWGRGTRRAIADWYNNRTPENLAYQLVKYQGRDGWTNRDLLRLSHAKPASEAHDSLFHWVTQGNLKAISREERGLQLIDAFEAAKQATEEKEIIRLIENCGLTREMVPTQFLTSRRVWEALLPKMPMTAMVRNLANMTRCELLKPFEPAVGTVIERLTNPELVRKARLHPLALLVALNTYKSGRGQRGGNTWTPVPKILAALEEAFYLAFDAIEPSNKKHLLCLDTSGSMTFSQIANMVGITPRVASAVMAMATARTEPESLFISYSDTASEMDFTAKTNLDAVIQRLQAYPAYGTNCASPIEHAIKRGYDIDTIVLYTDSETNTNGARQPVVALNDLRNKLGHDVKFIVVGMVANRFTVADPNDASMLDVVGFDTAAPAVMSRFSAGEL